MKRPQSPRRKKNLTSEQEQILRRKIDSWQRRRTVPEETKWHMRHKPYTDQDRQAPVPDRE